MTGVPGLIEIVIGATINLGTSFRLGISLDALAVLVGVDLDNPGVTEMQSDLVGMTGWC